MFPVIEVSGTPFEHGRQHGERAKERVERSLANYARLFAFNGMDWGDAQQRALKYRDLIGAFDAALLDPAGAELGLGRRATRGVDSAAGSRSR